MNKGLIIAVSVCVIGLTLLLSGPRFVHAYDGYRLNHVDHKALLVAWWSLTFTQI